MITEATKGIVILLRNNVTDPKDRGTTTTETFSGNGTTKTFTLSNKQLKNVIDVDVTGETLTYTVHYDNPANSSDYPSITFTTAPKSGIDNISIEYHYGATWIYPSFPRLDATMPRISLRVLSCVFDEHAIGSYITNTAKGSLYITRFQIDVWVKDKEILEIDGTKYSGGKLLDKLSDDVLDTIFDNRRWLKRNYNILDIRLTNSRPWPYDEEHQLFRQTLDFELLCEEESDLATELHSTLFGGPGYSHTDLRDKEVNGVIDHDLSNISQGIGNIGDGTNYAQFSDTGQFTASGDARWYNHFRIDPERFRLPAENAPSYGLKGVFPTLDFNRNTEESAYLSDYVPYRKDELSNIGIDISWTSETATGAVVWGVEYLSIAEGEIVEGATTTVTQVGHCNEAGKFNRTVFETDISAANIASDEDIALRLFRKADDDADTLNEDARLVGVHLLFISNKFGKPL